MPNIEWTEDFCSGNLKIDEQHKRWIEIYNVAHDKMMGKIPVENKQDIGRDALDDMIEYVNFHFESEEAIMESTNYPGLDDHREIHHSFSKKLANIQQNLKEGTWVLNSEIIKTIENWLIGHILTEDKKIFNR